MHLSRWVVGVQPLTCQDFYYCDRKREDICSEMCTQRVQSVHQDKTRDTTLQKPRVTLVQYEFTKQKVSL